METAHSRIPHYAEIGIRIAADGRLALVKRSA
jgi:hypothetical protein